MCNRQVCAKIYIFLISTASDHTMYLKITSLHPANITANSSSMGTLVLCMQYFTLPPPQYHTGDCCSSIPDIAPLTHYICLRIAVFLTATTNQYAKVVTTLLVKGDYLFFKRTAGSHADKIFSPNPALTSACRSLILELLQCLKTDTLIPSISYVNI